MIYAACVVTQGVTGIAFSSRIVSTFLLKMKVLNNETEVPLSRHPLWNQQTARLHPMESVFDVWSMNYISFTRRKSLTIRVFSKCWIRNIKGRNAQRGVKFRLFSPHCSTLLTRMVSLMTSCEFAFPINVQQCVMYKLYKSWTVVDKCWNKYACILWDIHARSNMHAYSNMHARCYMHAYFEICMHTTKLCMHTCIYACILEMCACICKKYACICMHMHAYMRKSEPICDFD